MSAMQEMLLNMILPKEEQEALKKALTPENIKSFINNVTVGYKGFTGQLNRIEANQKIIMEHLGLEPAHVSNGDNGSGERTAAGTDGEPRRLAG
jgi:hypothetical protein